MTLLALGLWIVIVAAVFVLLGFWVALMVGSALFGGYSMGQGAALARRRPPR